MRASPDASASIASYLAWPIHRMSPAAEIEALAKVPRGSRSCTA
jgi:hypothetical protein